MLVWQDITKDYWHGRTTLIAKCSFRWFPPDTSEYGKCREAEGSLWINPYSFYLSELDCEHHYRFILIVNSTLHYYVDSLENGKKIAEIIYEGLLNKYKELGNDPVV